MARIAIIDDSLPTQIQENPGEFDGLEVVWSGTDLDDLFTKAAQLRPSVVIANLDHLPSQSWPDVSRRIVEQTRADLVLSLYTFARRSELDSLSNEKVRAIKAPITLKRLRAQMMGVLIKDMFSGAAEMSPRPQPAPKRAAHVEVPERFTGQQLARLMEIQSAVDCECPNHLSELVQSLSAFERYSAQCENKDDKDAKMHAYLHRKTGEARAIMEEALRQLIKHEGIVL